MFYTTFKILLISRTVGIKLTSIFHL